MEEREEKHRSKNELKAANRLLIALALAGAALAKEPPHRWEAGRVLAQSNETSPGGFYAAPIGNGVIGVPIARRLNTVRIESEGYVYTWLENTAKSHGYIVLPVGGPIAFYRDKNWFIVIDTRHKKHYFSLEAQQVMVRAR